MRHRARVPDAIAATADIINSYLVDLLALTSGGDVSSEHGCVDASLRPTPRAPPRLDAWVWRPKEPGRSREQDVNKSRYVDAGTPRGDKISWWALVRDTLLSMRMRILCIKYLDMQATGSPSERERVIVCFWRAAPGEAGDVRYVERGEL